MRDRVITMPVDRLRDMARDDLPRVARIWLDSWRATGLTAHADPSEAELREELEQAGWRVRLACSGADVGGFVAFEAGNRQLCQLFVDPPQQRRGVGTMLLDEVKRQMPQGFWLRAAADNIRARTFYERRGLRLDGEQPRPDTSSMVAIYVWP